MWKRGKNGDGVPSRACFSLVHQYIQRFNEVSGSKTAAVRRRSKTPGVMITQYVTNLPEGKSTPDFQCKPEPITVHEGKLAVFKAVVTGDPKPDVSWRRAKGNVTDKDKFLKKYDESTGEHILEIYKVTAEESDIYKCLAVNEHGKAVCTTTLTVIDGTTIPGDFRKLLRRSKEVKIDEENDEKFWDEMLNADRRDYERICSENGFTDLHLILQKLEERKRRRGEDKNKADVIPYDDDDDDNDDYDTRCYGNNTSAKIQNGYRLSRRSSSVADINYSNQSFKQREAEEDLLIAEFKLSNVDFVIKIQEVDAKERDDALFECVLTHPLPTITWMKSGQALENGEKYTITVSEHKLIHRLLIKDCNKTDKGIYSAVAGITSCSAWLVVEENIPGGRKTIRKSALIGGVQTDLEKVAKRQQQKNQKELEKILDAIKAKQAVGETKNGKVLSKNGERCNSNGMQQKADWRGSEEEDAGEYVWSTADEVQEMKARRAENQITSGELIRHSEFTEEGDDEDEDQIFYLAQPNSVKIPEGDNCSKSKRNPKQSKMVQRDETSSECDTDSIEQESDDDYMTEDVVEEGDVSNKTKHHYPPKQSQKPKIATPADEKTLTGRSTGEGTECNSCSSAHVRRKRQGLLIEDTVSDPGVQFIWGLSDVEAIINMSAELTCKLNNEDSEGEWFRDGRKIYPDDNFSITKDGPFHKLVIIKCTEDHSGKYRFEADGRKTEAMVNVKDPPRFTPEDLCVFTEPLLVKVGHNAVFKLQFVGHQPIKIQWYRDGEELKDDNSAKIENSAGHSRLLLSRCQRKDMGEIRIKLKNEHGFTEAFSQLIVLDKPTPPLGPADVIESSAMCIEFKWRPPKDDGGSPVINYVMERQQVGRNTWKKIGEIPGVTTYRDKDVDRGRKYCYRIRAMTSEGTSEAMETDEMQAGTFAFPGSPARPQVVSSFHDCINLSWAPPVNTGGSRILGYVLEKRKKGSNLWALVNGPDELIKERKCAVKDVVEGIEYEFRVSAVNLSGGGEFSDPSEFVFARDPKKPPGKVIGLKVTETSHTNVVLTWTKPDDKPEIQDEAKGYFVEIRHSDSLEWSRCNSSPFFLTNFTVRGLKAMEMYWLRVIAVNDGGEGAAEELPNYVLAMPLPVRPKFTNRMKNFMVVRAGNSVRINVNFEASPQPQVVWLKDNMPVGKHVTVSNSDCSSQLLIPCSERSDSGIYSVLVKNLVGQETSSTEIRVTDDPKPPGPVELEENVPGTVTVIWDPSPDEKRDDRLHYTVSKLDSSKRTWVTVADQLFNNRFTVCNIIPGREYHFRVCAKNDMGVSEPSESSTWGTEKKKDKVVASEGACRDCDWRSAPTFIVPLKLHTATRGYECYMSCAVKGDPTPHISWYRNHVSLNTDTNYYISNTCGVCSLTILSVGPKDVGEYTVIAENSLGRAECSTSLSVRD